MQIRVAQEEKERGSVGDSGKDSEGEEKPSESNSPWNLSNGDGCTHLGNWTADQ